MDTPLASARPDFTEMAQRLMRLTPQERTILRLRFALDGSYYHTLTDVANGLKMTADDVRAIEADALRMLQGTAID
ncbi:MAG: hypothetical protein LC793_17560 [Thermomicrobia bacterium]|nr:hypothetical protein [Thermomicrobia bacterium]